MDSIFSNALTNGNEAVRILVPSGEFTLDVVLSTAFIKLIKKRYKGDVLVRRVRTYDHNKENEDEKDMPTLSIGVDGCPYNLSCDTRQNGINCSNFTTLWNKIGYLLVPDKFERDTFDLTFAFTIDNYLSDGGYLQLADLIESMNPQWDSPELQRGLTNDLFMQPRSHFIAAVDVCMGLLNSKIGMMKSHARIEEWIKLEINKSVTSNDSRILILDKYIRPNRFIESKGYAFIISPGPSDTSILTSVRRFSYNKSLPPFPSIWINHPPRGIITPPTSSLESVLCTNIATAMNIAKSILDGRFRDDYTDDELSNIDTSSWGK